MKDSKLLQSIAELDASEMKRFQEYVHSPFFNKHEKLNGLIDIIVETAPDFESDFLQKEKVFEQLFEGEPFDPQKISDLMTYLYRLLEGFLSQMTFESSDAKQELTKLAALRRREMDKNFQSNLKKLSKNGVLNEGLSEHRFYHWYELEKESDLFFMKKDSRSKDKSIERKTKNLDLFYLNAKLKDCCEMINRQNIVSEHYEILMLKELKQYVHDHYEFFEAYPSILIYYWILMTLQESGNESHYFKLIELLENNSDALEKDELRTMYDYAQNYCIKQINSGKTEYLNEIFKLYKLLLDRGIIFENNHLSQWDYKNIVTVGSRLKEYDWTEQFIYEYKERLPQEDEENAFAYNLASLYYSQGQYGKALQLLRDVEFTDVYYSLGARSLLLKVYYESGEFDPLYSLIDSFKIYIKRNKLISDYQYRVHLNLIKMTRRLANLKLKSISARKETVQRDAKKLRKRIETTNEITNLNWLMEKLVEING